MVTQAVRDQHDDVMFNTALLDLSTMVGRSVTVHSEQFPGRPLATRVIEARENSLTLDRGGAERSIDTLVSNQQIALCFQYKGEEITVAALLKRTSGGRCRIFLDDKALPLMRRRFIRVRMSFPVRMAVMAGPAFHPKKLKNMRWMETESVNLSGGGLLLDLSSRLEKGTKLFVNLALDQFEFPVLMIGCVRHSIQPETGHFYTGVEFLTDMQARVEVPENILKLLPPAVFEFTAPKRAEMNQALIAWKKKNRL
ncbi:MAG TPA: PilZ domain-containing protein [candidate division Zixibacteria bacterium]|nr:PilZ domain-containing protein [candidate division Zixibacteria bacterium]